MEHDELAELAGLYVLGTLTADERKTFDAHLPSCSACQTEVASLRLVADALGQAVPQVDPPAALRSRVLAAVSQDGSPYRKIAKKTAMEKSTQTSRGSMLPWLATAAALVLAIGLGVYALQLRGRVRTLQTQLQDATARIEAGTQQLTDARRLVAQTQFTVGVIASADLARIDLVGQKASPDAMARALWSRARGLVFTATALPPAPDGRTYQLWVLTAQKMPISVGVLKPDAGGRASVVFNTPADMPQPAAMAVTLEPEGGVPSPTGAQYLAGSLN